MAIDTERFINYAAAKIPPAQIAAAFGITPARVTQLLAEPKVKELVDRKKAEQALENLETVTTIRSAKKKLLNRIHDLVEDTDSLGEATRAYEILSKLPDGQDGQHRDRANPNIIALELPGFLSMRLSVELSGQNEIIGLDNRMMTTMPTLHTHRLIKERTRNDQGNEPRDITEERDATET